jgi:TonB family protein
MLPRRPFLRSSYALLHLSEVPADAAVFGNRSGRAGGALGTAVATHAVIAADLWAVAGTPDRVPPSAAAAASAIAPFVFTDATGDGSGRSGGGNRARQPAPLLRTRGGDALAVATSAPRTLATPESIAPEADPTPALPVQAMNAGELPQLGAVDGVPGPPTDARGPGDSGVGTRTGNDRGLGVTRGPGIGEGPYGIGNGVTAPALIHRTQPQYTAEAMRAKLQGVAVLSGVVGVDGTLHDVRVVRSLDGTFGLDQQAIACVRQWRFRPGTRLGTPVAVSVTIEVGFNLR